MKSQTNPRKIVSEFVLGIPALAALMFTLPASAQYVGPNTMTAPASVAATSTNTTYASSNWVASAVNAQKIGVSVTAKLTGAGTTATVYKFDASLDGVNWETAAYSLTITPAGTTAVTKTANFDLGGLAYIRLSSVENPNANAITNILIKTGSKKGT